MSHGHGSFGGGGRRSSGEGRHGSGSFGHGGHGSFHSHRFWSRDGGGGGRRASWEGAASDFGRIFYREPYWWMPPLWLPLGIAAASYVASEPSADSGSGTPRKERRWVRWLPLLNIFTVLVAMFLYFVEFSSITLELASHESRLFTTNSVFTTSITAKPISSSRWSSLEELSFASFSGVPELDVVKHWNTSLPNFSIKRDGYEHWGYYLNKGSKVTLAYDVHGGHAARLYIIQGSSQLEQWTQNPESFNHYSILHDKGEVSFSASSDGIYYFAFGNFESSSVQMSANLFFTSFIYSNKNSTNECILNYGKSCRIDVGFLSNNCAVISTPFIHTDRMWEVKITYESRWISYFCLISGIWSLTLALKLLDMKFASQGMTSEGEIALESSPLVSGQRPAPSPPKETPFPFSKPRAPLPKSWVASPKRNDNSDQTWIRTPNGTGSNVNAKVGSNSSSNIAGSDSRLSRAEEMSGICSICMDNPKNTILLDCGHMSICHSCAKILLDSTSPSCPICRSSIRKVVRIYQT